MHETRRALLPARSSWLLAGRCAARLGLSFCLAGLATGGWAAEAASAAPASPATASEPRSTQQDAVALLAEARRYLQAHGMQQAVVEFNRLDGPFNSRSAINPNGDLYLFSIAPNGYQAVHGKNPKIQGKVMIDMRDADGVYLIRELARICFETPEGKGWFPYKWPHPLTHRVERKLGYVERVPGTDFCLGTGIYP